MNKPQKHADLIHAWADGAEIEFFDVTCNKWISPDAPTWYEGTQYRIKPKPKTKLIKFRNYLTKTFDVAVFTHKPASGVDINFLQWLGDWQEVEVQ